MTNLRDFYISRSNNPENPKKNRCLLECAKVVHVADKVRYLHTMNDLIRACRSRKDLVIDRIPRLKNKSIGKIRSYLSYLGYVGYLVEVKEKNHKKGEPRHAMVLNKEGKTAVDTDPRKRDHRIVLNVYGIKRS